MSQTSPETIFFAALERSPSERAAYLDGACGGDAELRAIIEKMLAAQPDLGEFLDRPHPVPAEALRAAGAFQPQADPSGAIVAGKYKLLQQIGEGGMGTVWMAEQLRPVKRRVAVKLVRSEHGSSESILARFGAERQAIALMDHPHVAKLLDAGTTDSSEATSLGAGRPYFVMELIKGVPLNEFCDQQQLTVPDRLHLFTQICSAVQHAHQKGVIHRDLKPSNVLVESHDGKPVPKVIDFGLAKAIGGLQLTENTLFTRLGTVAGSPLYMAPEQATFNALDVDTRADVYSLGVILYELLTGTTPIEHAQLKAAPLDEIFRVIRENDPPTPSSRLSSSDSKPSVAANRRTEPLKLGRFLRGDLDWIVMKALAKERDRRYESANGFAADVECFLKHEPVLAGPPGAAYRLSKFVRRNRPQVIAGCLLLLALLAGIAGTTSGMIWAVGAQADEVTQRGIAEGKEAKAVAAARAEKTAKEQEADQRKKAEKEWDRAEGLLYASQLELALGAWREKNARLARHHLEKTRPERRGWEYDFIDTLFEHRGQRTFRGHTAEVVGVCFSPDGKRLASASCDQTVKVWDAATGQDVLTLEGHTNTVTSVAFSPDGKRILTGGEDKTAKVWDAATGKHVRTLEGHTQAVKSVAFSPDGKRILTGGDKTAKVWDAATGRELLTLKGHTGGANSVCFSQDGERIASTDFYSVRVWDANKGKLLLTLKGHTGGVNSACFSQDGKRIASASGNPTLESGEVKVWDADTGKPVFTIKDRTHDWVKSVCFSPDGKRLATASAAANSDVRVWDATTGRELLTLQGHTGSVFGVSFSPDGKRLASGGDDKTVKLWDAVAGQQILTLGDHANGGPRVCLSPDGARVVIGGEKQTVKVWDTATGQAVLTLEGHKADVHSAAFSHDGKRIATASSDHTAKVWDAQKGQVILTLEGHKHGVHCVAFSPDGKRIVTGSEDGTAKVWDAQKGTELLTLKGHTREVRSVAFSPDGKRILTGGRHDATPKVWDATTGRELLTLKGHTSVTSVAFSPDGRRIVTGSVDETAKVWDAATGQEVLTLRGHTDGVSSVAFSPDGRRIVTGSEDETAKVWDAATGQEVLTLKGHAGGVTCVCFSRGGRLATGSWDMTVKLWDAGKGPSGPLP